MRMMNSFLTTHVNESERFNYQNKARNRSRKKRKVLANDSRKLYTFRVVIYFMIAFLGCSWQIYEISSQYLEYATVTQLTIERPKFIKPPSVVYCVVPSYEELVMLDKFRYLIRKKNITSLLQLTITDIINVTPTPDELVLICYQHFSTGADDTSSMDCRTNFRITRLYKQEQVCYQFDLIFDETLEIKQLTSSWNVNTGIYGFVFDPNMVRHSTTALFFLVDSMEDFRGLSDNFVEHSRHIINNRTGLAKDNHISLSYSTFRSTLLEYPYLTNCIDYEMFDFRSQPECFEMCVANRLITLGNLTTFSIMTKENDTHLADYRPITFTHTQVLPKLGLFLKLIEINCSRLCLKPDCVKNDHVPIISAAITSRKPGFDLHVPKKPDIITIFIPKIRIIDYISFALSLTGVWLSLSPVVVLTTLDNIFRRRRKKCKSLKKSRTTKFNLVRRSSIVDEEREMFEELLKLRSKLTLMNANYRKRQFQLNRIKMYLAHH